MILAGLIKVLMFILMTLVFLLPTYVPPPAADLGPFAVISWLVPVRELVVLTAAMVGFATATLIYVVTNWIINKIRGSG